MSDEEKRSVESPILRRYYELRQYLGVTTVDLDKSYEETPRIHEEAGVLAAKAGAEELAAKHTYDIIKADASVRLRSALIHGKEPSEARITSLLPLEEDVQEARQALDEAHYRTEVCQVLYKALDTQARLLPSASQMSLHGLMSPTVAYERQRKEMREARIADERQHTEKEHHRLGRPVA